MQLFRSCVTRLPVEYGESMSMLKLHDLTTKVRSKRPEADFVYIDLSAVDSVTKSVVGARMLKASAAPSRARQLLQPGDVLVSTVRPNLNSVAVVGLEHDGAIGSTGFCVLRADVSKLDNRFLFYWVRSESFVSEMTRLASGASYPAVSDAVIKNSLIPLPELSEQKRIAAILDEADVLRLKCRQSLLLVEEYCNAQFDLIYQQHLLIDGSDWPELDYLIESMQLGLVRSSKEIGPDFSINYVRMSAISSNGDLTIDPLEKTNANDLEIQKYSLRKGDFLFNTRNSQTLVGKSALVSEDLNAVFNNNIARIRFKDFVHPAYVAMLFRHKAITDQLEKLKSGTTSVFAIYGRDLKKVKIPIANSEVQLQIAQLFESTNYQKMIINKQIKLLDELFASLQDRAFRGEL